MLPVYADVHDIGNIITLRTYQEEQVGRSDRTPKFLHLLRGENLLPFHPDTFSYKVFHYRVFKRVCIKRNAALLCPGEPIQCCSRNACFLRPVIESDVGISIMECATVVSIHGRGSLLTDPREER